MKELGCSNRLNKRIKKFFIRQWNISWYCCYFFLWTLMRVTLGSKINECLKKFRKNKIQWKLNMIKSLYWVHFRPMECVILRSFTILCGPCLLSTHPGWCESSQECWCSQVLSTSSFPHAQNLPECFYQFFENIFREIIIFYFPDLYYCEPTDDAWARCLG